MHRCKKLSFDNKCFKIHMFRSIIIIIRELLNFTETYMNSKLMHGYEYSKEIFVCFPGITTHCGCIFTAR